MTDEKFFALLVACIGFLIGVIAMGVLAGVVGGGAGDALRIGGVALGLLIAYALWRHTA